MKFNLNKIVSFQVEDVEKNVNFEFIQENMYLIFDLKSFVYRFGPNVNFDMEEILN